ncbi:TPA: hypothetical protein ACKP7K_004687 [Serratia marcescens]
MEKLNNLFDEDFPSSSSDSQVKKLPPNRLRIHSVTVRLSDIELRRVNECRNQKSKSSWLRDSAFNNIPPIVPEINISAWKELSFSMQKLNNLTQFLSRRGEESQPLSHELNALKVKIGHLRDALIAFEPK